MSLFATEEQAQAAHLVVRKASAYRMIQTGTVHRALGLGGPTSAEIDKAAQALDDALAAYEVSRYAQQRAPYCTVCERPLHGYVGPMCRYCDPEAADE